MQDMRRIELRWDPDKARDAWPLPANGNCKTGQPRPAPDQPAVQSLSGARENGTRREFDILAVIWNSSSVGRAAARKDARAGSIPVCSAIIT